MRFFFVPAFVLEEVLVFRLAELCLAVVLLVAALFGGEVSGVVAAAWVNAGCKSPGTINIPTKTATAKRRTQTLPTAGSWHP